MSDQSTLWGIALSFWDLWGVRLMVLGGLLGFCSVVTSVASAYVLYRVADVQNRELVIRSNEFSDRSKILERETAEANERAAIAQLELANFRKPRVFNDAQMAMLVERLKLFAGTQFDTAMPLDDLEPGVLAGLIERVLHSSNWRQIDWSGTAAIVIRRPDRSIAGTCTVRDVLIIVPPAAKDALLPAAAALGAALNEVAIKSVVLVGGGPNNHNQNTIHILVGRKT